MVTPPFESSVPQPNEPVKRPVVALNDLAAADNVVAVVQGDDDGSFQIDNVPPGTYLLTIWDVDQDYILARYNITVGANQTVDLNDVGVFRWFGWMSGFVYLDNGIARDGTPITDANTTQQLGPDGTPFPAGTPFARNGVRDCYDPDGAAPFTADPFAYGTCETGLVGEEVLLKLRDGSIKAGTVTDGNGWYELPEARGPLNRYMVSEVGAGRREWTGHSLHQEFNLDPAAPPNPAWDPYLSTRLPGDAGGDLLLSSLVIEGHRSWVDWGKDNREPLDPENDDNGGIGAPCSTAPRERVQPPPRRPGGLRARNRCGSRPAVGHKRHTGRPERRRAPHGGCQRRVGPSNGPGQRRPQHGMHGARQPRQPRPRAHAADGLGAVPRGTAERQRDAGRAVGRRLGHRGRLQRRHLGAARRPDRRGRGRRLRRRPQPRRATRRTDPRRPGRPRGVHRGESRRVHPHGERPVRGRGPAAPLLPVAQGGGPEHRRGRQHRPCAPAAAVRGRAAHGGRPPQPGRRNDDPAVRPQAGDGPGRPERRRRVHPVHRVRGVRRRQRGDCTALEHRPGGSQ